MTHLLLLLTLFLPAHGARYSRAHLAKERTSLERLQTKFTKFQEVVNETDAKFEELRTAVSENRNREAGSLADELTTLISNARRRFRDIEDFYSDAKRRKINYSRFGLIRSMNFEPDFLAYLAFRHNNRFNSGVPIEHQLAAWRGLSIGKKMEHWPDGLQKSGKLKGLPLKANDSLLIMTTNGGFIRGRYEGMVGHSYVLRESLPISLAKLQQKMGYYRVLNLKEVARVELVRKPRTLTAQETPVSPVVTNGDYSRSWVHDDHVWRIDIQPSDTEILDLVKARRFADAQYSARIAKVDLDSENHPAYAPIFFADCSSFLQ